MNFFSAAVCEYSHNGCEVLTFTPSCNQRRHRGDDYAMSSDLYLSCLITTDVDNWQRGMFQISISPFQKVGTLQELIVKAKGLYGTVDLSLVQVWKVSIPLDACFVQNFEIEYQRIKLSDPLFSSSTMSEVLQDKPAENHLHLIVHFPWEGESNLGSFHIS